MQESKLAGHASLIHGVVLLGDMSITVSQVPIPAPARPREADRGLWRLVS